MIPDSTGTDTVPHTVFRFPGWLFGPTLLSLFLIWDLIDRRISTRNKQKYRPFPLPTPSERKYHTSNVSIVIPTVDTDASFTTSLCGFLGNKPLEIIVVTIEGEKYRVQELVHNATVQKFRSPQTAVKILTVPHANKRDQLVCGINASKGDIVALVDDDAFWSRENLLLTLLAPFQRDDVGLVGCAVTKSSTAITPWEVAAIRLRGTRHGSMKSAYATDGGINFCVSGVTMLVRGEILRDHEFQDAFIHDLWMGKKQNSGDDTFVTRWVLFQHHRQNHRHRNNELEQVQLNGEITQCQHQGQLGDQSAIPKNNINGLDSSSTGISSPVSTAISGRKQWKLGMQLTPESEVGTSIMPDSRFAGQLKRWYRSGLRHRLMCLFYEPGAVAMFHTCPYMTRKMVEGMLNPILLPLRMYALYETCRVWPLLGFLVLIWKFTWYTHSLVNFVNEYPWASRYWWAAVLVDHLYLVSDWYCWMTLGTEAWMTRRKVDQDHQAPDPENDRNDGDHDEPHGEEYNSIAGLCVNDPAASELDQSSGTRQQDWKTGLDLMTASA
ncbi:hypothetical protein ABEF92_002106 [Exophiala dermatitidis]|uniref:Uncharacterized protein n=1 Tax=Exophiala dermatitidis (strain ATCC 34100 / CBS 525.76 / NIH/UT8656) TaxID=858893 RepID=H6C2N7_EXODN|nr:uncharacterized protein HMPREF1120_05975 [Exophiala dermatitidis NIH/UT8656]EHY57955.1 hypothetical protein HMPREF1120_05975 [Exophiala dermatitidis NIH/UT8656]KAJ4535645.1 hypothetical protein HRR78_008774 [Exophiala dermatitidis]